jgi:tritrans,polycis-undecaprenyl-diphosphate synthase [geranylgeranyl-diphosphate specific]
MKGRIRAIRHLAFIPDGNRRWARRHHLPVLKGHERGIERMGDVLKWCRSFRIRMVSFWAFSTENLRRSKREVKGLFKAFDERLQKVIKEGNFAKYGVRMRFIGDRSIFPSNVQAGMHKVEEETKSNSKYFVNLFVGYGGRAEIVHMARKIAQDFSKNPQKINEKAISDRLWTAGLPDPDLIIRTSGEQRLSGFMPFQSTYSELYFCKKLWPDISKKDIKAALDDFRKRQRRWGR